MVGYILAYALDFLEEKINNKSGKSRSFHQHGTFSVMGVSACVDNSKLVANFGGISIDAAGIKAAAAVAGAATFDIFKSLQEGDKTADFVVGICAVKSINWLHIITTLRRLYIFRRLRLTSTVILNQSHAV